MLVLFDHGTPRGLARVLSNHTVITAQARGWDRLTNGVLLNAAEEAEFDLLPTTDRRIRYQQNLAGRRIAIIVLAGSTKMDSGAKASGAHRRRGQHRYAGQLFSG